MKRFLCAVTKRKTTPCIAGAPSAMCRLEPTPLCLITVFNVLWNKKTFVKQLPSPSTCAIVSEHSVSLLSTEMKCISPGIISDPSQFNTNTKKGSNGWQDCQPPGNQSIYTTHHIKKLPELVSKHNTDSQQHHCKFTENLY